LTGFDAPPCTYLYLDRSLQDHGLFQAICRTNRLDGEDKDFGYIVDYKDLFRKVKGAISVYTSDLDDSSSGNPEDINIKDRLVIGKERLDNAVEAMEALLVPVMPPKDTIDYQHYFCGNTEIPEDLMAREYLRTTLYSSVANFVRAFVNISNEFKDAGYSEEQIAGLIQKRDRYIAIRTDIKRTSGEELDLKPYEADMRNLLDMYIQAEDSKVVSKFDNKSLLDVVKILGIHEALKTLPQSIQKHKAAVAETIENNVRSKIIKDYAIDPAFYDKLSLLLDTLIKERKADAINYQKYLEKIKEIIDSLNTGKSVDTPTSLDTPGKVALYNNLNQDEKLALLIDRVVRSVIQDGFRGNPAKERIIQGKIYEVLKDEYEVRRIFDIIVNQPEY
jgi:type I restriction enzyme R subunit